MKQSEIKRVLAQRELARRSLKAHLDYKFKYFYQKPLLDNWHIGYLCEILEAVLRGEITRLMLNLPPSYGKTEIVGRTLIPYGIGRNPQHKFIYTSYGDELSIKTSDEARTYFKSSEFMHLFAHENLTTDQASHWRLPQGGGLYATTVGGAVTGFHAHTIIIDDPIKASEAHSQAVRKRVSSYFSGSLLSRLDETKEKKASIVLIMQRLHKDDLCGELLREHGGEWEHVMLEALNSEPRHYEIGGFSYERGANEPLFEAKHSLKDLEHKRIAMGAYEWSAQMQQDPSEGEGGIFDVELLSYINDYEIPELSEYIFVDASESLKESSDERAIVCEGWAIDESEREMCIMLDCYHGRWSEDEFCAQMINMMIAHPSAPLYIEAAGGGITAHRLLQKEVARVNALRRSEGQESIKNPIFSFTPRRDISKNAGILSMLSYFNVGQLKIRRTASGLEQIKREFKKFNPDKGSNEDNCIDALSKGFVLEGVVSPKRKEKQKPRGSRYATARTWRI
ncbi:MAG: hypothetical protein ACTTH5_02945 [Wolinella sp.]